MFERLAACGDEEDRRWTWTDQEAKGDLRLHPRYAAKTGYPPTVREIGKAVGLHSSSTVHAHLANLEKIGLLRRDPRSRGRSSCSSTRRRGRSCPKAAAAGRPGRRRRADPRRGEHRGVHRDPDVIGGEDGDYILRVRGEA
jgi:repressor LexA